MSLTSVSFVCFCPFTVVGRESALCRDVHVGDRFSSCHSCHHCGECCRVSSSLVCTWLTVLCSLLLFLSTSEFMALRLGVSCCLAVCSHNPECNEKKIKGKHLALGHTSAYILNRLSYLFSWHADDGDIHWQPRERKERVWAFLGA